jgi:hypothetical protein
VRGVYGLDVTLGKNKKIQNYALFGIAFIENSFFPFPPDVSHIPLIIAEPEKMVPESINMCCGFRLWRFLRERVVNGMCVVSGCLRTQKGA